MGLPNINITFKKAAAAAAQKADRGIMAMILTEQPVEPEGTVTAANYILRSEADIPSGISADNEAHIRRAFAGMSTGEGVLKPAKIFLWVGGDITDGLAYMRGINFGWLVGPHDMSAEDAAEVKTWIEARWADKQYKMAVLPNVTADHEGIVNVQTDTIAVGDDTFTAAEYCARIAGIICACPASMSVTSAVLPEVTGVTAKTKTEIDTAVNAGKLVLWHDGEKVKIARGVTSLTTTTGKIASLKKIRIANIIATVQDELRRLIDDEYIGKVINTFDNKCILVSAVRSYLSGIAAAGMIDGDYETGIDLDAQRDWLAANDIDVADMTDDEVLHANTDDEVFIKCAVTMMDAIENVAIEFSI